MATKKKAVASTKKVKKTDEELVADYMQQLKHPLFDEIELVRALIQSADKEIKERIKWNAPSYYYKEDMVTFNPRDLKRVHLVFHHPAIEKIKSPILEGDYKGRRMTYFADAADIKAKKKELIRHINNQ